MKRWGNIKEGEYLKKNMKIKEGEYNLLPKNKKRIIHNNCN